MCRRLEPATSPNRTGALAPERTNRAFHKHHRRPGPDCPGAAAVGGTSPELSTNSLRVFRNTAHAFSSFSQLRVSSSARDVSAPRARHFAEPNGGSRGREDEPSLPQASSSSGAGLSGRCCRGDISRTLYKLVESFPEHRPRLLFVFAAQGVIERSGCVGASSPPLRRTERGLSRPRGRTEPSTSIIVVRGRTVRALLSGGHLPNSLRTR